LVFFSVALESREEKDSGIRSKKEDGIGQQQSVYISKADTQIKTNMTDAAVSRLIRVLVALMYFLDFFGFMQSGLST